MIDEKTIIEILKWLKEAENQTIEKEKKYKQDNIANELTYARLRGSEVAYHNTISYIEELTGILVEDL